MRPASYYYLAQTWRPRDTQPAAPSRAKGRGRHARVVRREFPGRELPAVARRVLAALTGTSQTA